MEEGLSEEGRGQGSTGGELQGSYPDESTGQYKVCSKPFHNTALAIDTLLLQM